MDAPEKVHSYSPNIDRDTTAYSDSDSHRTGERNGIALDISGTVMDNTAYGGHGRTTEDVMQEAGQQDVASRRNYMAIMSNTLSKEDFAELQEEGIHPGDMEVDAAVTIIDHIKAAIVQGGTDVAGYTDDMDTADLEKITGNKVLAQELVKQFRMKDIPVTEENGKAAAEAWEKARQIIDLSEGAVKYMVENKLPPTVENLYMAQFSGGTDAGRQGRGYYAQDMNGYYARKADHYNWKDLEPQMNKVIAEAGYESNEDTLADSRWLVEKGIPLNPDSFAALQQLRELHLPQTMEEIAGAIAAAIADGRNPLAADLYDPRSNLEKAVVHVTEVAEIHDQAIDAVLSEKKSLNIKNLLAAQNREERYLKNREERFGGQQEGQFLEESTSPEAIAARRQLEEIRLKMTVEANLRLLRNGIRIATEPLEQLVDRLREAEETIRMQLTGARSGEEAANRFSLYRETVSKVNAVSAMPAALIGRMAIADPSDITTLNGIYESGSVLKSAYEKAGETYETVMTVPRKDMGDSIRKAFRNVDDILEDMRLPLDDSNRRAVRILGYNSMELSLENIDAIKEKDSLLQDVITKMKPGTVLEMIREKVNPLTMSLEELQSYLSGKSGKEETAEASMEDYGRFLYKLERKEGITEQERKVYIGVYRLLRQIEKGDGAVVGAMVNANLEFSMGNLLSALKSGRKQGMEVVVDDSFGGISAKDSPEDLMKNMTEIMESLESEQVDGEYAEEQIKEVRTLKNMHDGVIRTLLDHHQPVTWNSLMAAGNMMKYPGMLFRKAAHYGRKTGKEEELKKSADNLLEKFTETGSANEAYEQLQETVTDIFESAAGDEQIKAVDVKEMGMMCRQISLAASFAKEERYEIPVEIDGEFTAVNLRIIRDKAEGGRMNAYISTEETGETTCELTVREGVLSGYVACGERTGLEKLRQSEDILYTMLNDLMKNNITETDIQVGKINFIQSGKPDPHHASGEEPPFATQGHDTKQEHDTEQVPTSTLYMAAKAFIGYFRKVS